MTIRPTTPPPCHPLHLTPEAQRQIAARGQALRQQVAQRRATRQTPPSLPTKQEG